VILSSGGGHAPGGQGLLVVGAHSKGWPALLPYPSGGHLIAPQKFSIVSQWAWGRVLVVSHSSPRASAQLPCLRDMSGLHKPAPCLCKVSLGLPHCLIKMRKFPKHHAWCRSLLISSIFFLKMDLLRQLCMPAWGSLWQLPTPARGGALGEEMLFPSGSGKGRRRKSLCTQVCRWPRGLLTRSRCTATLADANSSFSLCCSTFLIFPAHLGCPFLSADFCPFLCWLYPVQYIIC